MQRHLDHLMAIRDDPQQDVLQDVEVATLDGDRLDHRLAVEPKAGRHVAELHAQAEAVHPVQDPAEELAIDGHVGPPAFDVAGCDHQGGIVPLGPHRLQEVGIVLMVAVHGGDIPTAGDAEAHPQRPTVAGLGLARHPGSALGRHPGGAVGRPGIDDDHLVAEVQPLEYGPDPR